MTHRWGLTVCLVFLLAACSVSSLPSVTNTPFTPTPPIAPSHTASAPPATLTPELTATPAPTLTPSSVPPTATAEDILYKTIELLPELPAGVRPPGSLILEGKDSFILHFEDTLRLEPLDKEIGCLSTSPDGQWLTYCPGDRRLFIQSADRQQHNTIWLEFDLWGPGWVNNQQLVFSSFKEFDKGIHPVVLVDPFTGKHVQSPIDFPGFRGTVCGPGGGTFQFGGTSLVYDPSLTLVVYPDMESDPANIVLWDLKDKKALAKIEEGICFGNYPLWSPDGLRFVVADYLKNSNPVSGEVVEEWASVSREGQVEWLTNFADYFKEVEIEGANWSPDGKRVAFWLRTKPELCQNEVQDLVNLAVLEIQTQIVINYCVWGEPFTAPPPVWSLDGRYIAIRKFDDQGVSQILLVDLEEGWAAPIAGPDVWPVGWLNAP